MFGKGESASTDPMDRHRDDMHDLGWHAVAYVIVNSLIVAQDLVAGGGLDWAYWTLVPWGIGLIAHGLAVFFSRNRHRMGTI